MPWEIKLCKYIKTDISIYKKKLYNGKDNKLYL